MANRPAVRMPEAQDPDLYRLKVGSNQAQHWARMQPHPQFGGGDVAQSPHHLWSYIRQTSMVTHQHWLLWIRHRTEIGYIPQPVAGWVWALIRGYTRLNADETHRLVAAVRYLLANYCTRLDDVQGRWELKPEWMWPRIECGAYTVDTERCTRRAGHQGRHVCASDPAEHYNAFANEKSEYVFLRSVREVA